MVVRPHALTHSLTSSLTYTVVTTLTNMCWTLTCGYLHVVTVVRLQHIHHSGDGLLVSVEVPSGVKVVQRRGRHGVPVGSSEVDGHRQRYLQPTGDELNGKREG